MTVGQENFWNPGASSRGDKSVFRSRWLGTALGFLAFVTAYYVAFRLGTTFYLASASPLWFPDAILLCTLLRSRPERWWLFLLGMLLVRLLSGGVNFPSWFLLATIAIDWAKALGGALVLRHFMRNPLRFETIRDLGVFALFAVLLIPSIAALAGASLRQMLGNDYWSVWTRWFFGDALAQLVVTPVILYWVFGTPRNIRVLDARRLVEAGLLAGGLILSGYWASTGPGSVTFAEARFYAPVPFLFWAAVRFGMFGASGALAVIASFTIGAAFMRTGPFSGLSPDEAVVALQNFLLLRSAPLYLIATSMDQRKAVERSLQESEERFRSMANSAPVLLWMSGPDKRCTFFNQGWLAFTGRTLDQELGNGWVEGVHPDDVNHCLEIYHSAFDARQRFEMEYRLRRHDGEYRWIFDAGAPRTTPSGEFAGYIGSALDITDRKGAEESNRALAHVQRLALIGELTAAIAHELKQPLSAIMSNADAAGTLLDTANPPLAEIREIVSDIRRADLRANEVLGHVRDFLRKREVFMQPLDLNSAVADVLPLVLGDARKRRIQLRTELAADLPPVFGNETQLQQVLINLIVNGMDAMGNTPEEKRDLVVRTARPDGDARVEVSVTDHGSGISSGSMPRLFESFFTTRAEGMGLGLSIARSIIETHGGRIWARNNPDGGATFHFTIPTATNRTSVPRDR